jgi:uncharacterized protein (TIGR02421 family)
MQTTPLTRQELDTDAAIERVGEQFQLVSALVPTNLRTERERFLTGKIAHPQFTYSINEELLREVRAQAEAITAPRTLIGELLEAKRIELVKKLDLLLSVGTDRFTELSQDIYGTPDKDILTYAHDLLRRYPVGNEAPESLRLTSDAVKIALEDVLHQYNLTDWEVVLNDRSVSGIIVNPHKRRISVAARTVLGVSRLAPLITHELETHVLTAVNGQAQPLQLFVLGFAGYLRTQEGLAAYNVMRQHEHIHRPARFWARNAIACDLTLRHSFREVFDAIRELGFADRFAFGVTTKVKRGLTDTSQHGGWTKEYLYLAGERDISRFVQDGGKIRDLYIGKINLRDLPTLQKAGWLVPPRVLPTFLDKPVSDTTPGAVEESA